MVGPSPDPALDDESRVGEIITILSVASVLSTVAVVLRCYSRAVMLRSFGLDDAFIIPAQILALATALAIGLEAKYGLGRHHWMMKEEHFIPYMKAFYSSIIVYNIGMCLTKIAILLQYQRIFSNTVLRKIIVSGLWFLGCWAVTLSFLLPMVCMPVAAFWDPDVDGFCLDNGTIWYVMAGVNVVTDFAVFTMPIPVISSLQLPRRQKIMLLFVFTIGIFPCAVSIYRIRTLRAAAQSTDPTWDNVDAATFSFLELSVGIIAICLPTLRPVLVKAMPGVFNSLRHSTGKSGGHNGPSVGRGSRNPFGPASSPSAGAVMLKSTLRESDSTEGLRPDDQPLQSRSRGGSDLELGELDSSQPPLHGPTPRMYSVSVVAGWGPVGDADGMNAASVDKSGIKTTTVVTQQVSAAAAGAKKSGEEAESY